MSELKSIELSDTLTHVALIGRLDEQGVDAVDLRLTSHVAARRRPAIVDLSGVEFLGSLGIGMLIRVAHALQAHGARLVLLGPTGRVEEVLRASKIDDVIPIATDRDDALGLLDIDS